MDVVDALNTRFTARAFKPDPIDRRILERIMEAALRSPSWANTQPWEVYVAGGEVLNRLARGLCCEPQELRGAKPRSCCAEAMAAKAPDADGGPAVRTHGDA